MYDVLSSKIRPLTVLIAVEIHVPARRRIAEFRTAFADGVGRNAPDPVAAGRPQPGAGAVVPFTRGWSPIVSCTPWPCCCKCRTYRPSGCSRLSLTSAPESHPIVVNQRVGAVGGKRGRCAGLNRFMFPPFMVNPPALVTEI